MERIAKFHKVSYEQFEGDWKDTFGPIETEEIKRIYEGIRLQGQLQDPQVMIFIHR